MLQDKALKIHIYPSDTHRRILCPRCGRFYHTYGCLSK